MKMIQNGEINGLDLEDEDLFNFLKSKEVVYQQEKKKSMSLTLHPTPK